MVNAPLSRIDLLVAIENARPGDKIVYHTGSLMFDRLNGRRFIEDNATALAAWTAMEEGKILLFQRRVRRAEVVGGRVVVAPVCEYIARKLPVPHVPVRWHGPYAVHKKYTRPEAATQEMSYAR